MASQPWLLVALFRNVKSMIVVLYIYSNLQRLLLDVILILIFLESFYIYAWIAFYIPMI